MASLRKKLSFLGLVAVAVILQSCVFYSPIRKASIIAGESFKQEIIDTDNYAIFTLHKHLSSDEQVLNVYIEGDGNAWINKSTISNDPTPHNPVALELSSSDQHSEVLYIARPCQYIQTKNCDNAHAWTSGRASKEVIATIDTVINKFTEQYKYKKTRIIGYSGGAMIAAILSAKRKGVIQLVTVAGILNHSAWTKWHNITPLSDSLNPINYIDKLQSIPQKHFCGEDDKIAPCKLAEDFLSLYESPAAYKFLEKIPNTTHQCCWSDV